MYLVYKNATREGGDFFRHFLVGMFQTLKKHCSPSHVAPPTSGTYPLSSNTWVTERFFRPRTNCPTKEIPAPDPRYHQLKLSIVVNNSIRFFRPRTNCPTKEIPAPDPRYHQLKLSIVVNNSIRFFRPRTNCPTKEIPTPDPRYHQSKLSIRPFGDTFRRNYRSVCLYFNSYFIIYNSDSLNLISSVNPGPLPRVYSAQRAPPGSPGPTAVAVEFWQRINVTFYIHCEFTSPAKVED